MKEKTKALKLVSMLGMACMLLLPITWGAAAQAAVLHDNGPLVNSPGTHPGGGDESIMRTGLGFTDFGFDISHLFTTIIFEGGGITITLDTRRAAGDDFTVPAGTTWTISSFDLFAFQEDATTPTITAAYLQIWDREPGTSGAISVWGDTTTNVLSSAALTDTYIVDAEGKDDDSRRVQKVSVATESLSLEPGTYWAVWSCDDYGDIGNIQYQPPVRDDAQITTGDAVEYLAIGAAAGVWSAIQDSGTGTGQGLPFTINGEFCTDLDEDGYGEGTLCDGPDCDDTDASVHVLMTYYRDADGDGYGDPDNTTDLCGIMTPPEGYVDNDTGYDVDDSDPFYTDLLPTCEVRVLPRILGWLIGDTEKTRSLLIIGKRGTDFTETPTIKWESDAIEGIKTSVFLKRFMFMRATFNGESLEKQEYRVLVNDCEGAIKWAR